MIWLTESLLRVRQFPLPASGYPLPEIPWMT